MNILIHQFDTGERADDAAALEQFQRQWATYQKLVDTDVLSHKDVGAILHDNLAALPEPFALLDIACGDAGQMPAALAGTRIRHYHGLDLSEPALELAAKNLAGEPFEVELDCGDFVEAVTKRPEPATRPASTASTATTDEVRRRSAVSLPGLTGQPSKRKPSQLLDARLRGHDNVQRLEECPFKDQSSTPRSISRGCLRRA